MKLGLILGFAVGFAGLAQAQEHDMHEMMEMPAKAGLAASATVAADSESTKAFKVVDAKMHKAMMAPGYTGDADVDFLRGMIPHHQGAVDMANVVLKYGTDADVRMFAGDIVKAQEKEIRWMQDWLTKHGPTVMPDAKASDVRVEAPVMAPAATMKVAAVLPVSSMIPVKATVSGTLVTPSMPPVDMISPTTASVSPAMVPVGTTAMMMDGMPAAMTPDMPTPDMAIVNEAPEMDLLDSGVTSGVTNIGEPKGEVKE